MAQKLKKIEKSTMKKIGIILMILLLVVVVLGIFLVRKDKKQISKQEEKIYPVSVLEAGETGNHVVLSYTGMVNPEEVSECTFEQIGTVQSVFVKMGDQVTEGQPLVVLDNEDALDELDSANEQLEYAQEARDNALERRDNAKKDYEDACSAKTEKENVEKAIMRRDEQQLKVNQLKEELKVIAQGEETEEGSGRYKVNSEDYYAKQLELQTAQETLSVYEQNVTTAQEAYEKKLEEGAESSEAKAQKERLETAEDNVDATQRSYDTALDNVERAQKAVDDCVLKAPKSGYVVKVTSTEGSVSTPVVPAVILASNEVVINFGVSQIDVNDIRVGMATQVIIEGETYQGSIKDIDVLPNQESRTYAVNVSFDSGNQKLRIGELATVKIDIGERLGIWVPLSVVLNDGKDYVYVVQDNRAKREYITMEEINNDQVLITGTTPGDLIICEGMKIIRSGSLVSYENKTEEPFQQQKEETKAK